MLKLTYTETSFHLERLSQSLEDWVQTRVILALRVGQPICTQPSTASFLLPVNLPGIEQLYAEAKHDSSEIIAVSAGDAEYIEISLRGSWLSIGAQSEEGVLVVAMSDRTEFFLEKLWQEAHKSASIVIE